MNKKILLIPALVGSLITTVHAQSKFGDNKATINGSSLVELESTNKGLLMPRISLANTTTWGLATNTPVNGMVVYNTNAVMVGTAAAPTLAGIVGMYYWDGAKWVGMNGIHKPEADTTYWALKGNSGTTPPTTTGSAVGTSNYWGTSDAKNLAVGTGGVTRAIFDRSGSLYGGATTYNAALPLITSLVWGNNNKDSANYTFVAGANHVISPTASLSTVTGNTNVLQGTDNQSAVVMGANNTLKGIGRYSAIFGNSNEYNGVIDGSTIMAGRGNIGYQAYASAIFGSGNKDSALNTIIAGNNNSIGIAAGAAQIFGVNNVISGVSGSTLVTGVGNVANNTTYSVIGGRRNILNGADYSGAFGSDNVDSASFTLVSGRYNIINNNAGFSIIAGDSNRIYGGPGADSRDVILTGSRNTLNGIGKNSAMFGYNNTYTGVTGGSAIVAGESNIGYNAPTSAIFGSTNIDSSSQNIMAGSGNVIGQGSNAAQVFGTNNAVSGSSYSALVSGVNNIAYTAPASAIFGGGNTDSAYSSLIVGSSNVNGPGGHDAIISGFNNTFTASPAIIVTGYGNSGSDIRYSVVAGRGNSLNSVFYSAVFGDNNHDSSSFILVTGRNNAITNNSSYTLVSGDGNRLTLGGDHRNVIVAGAGNELNGVSRSSAIFGAGNVFTGVGNGAAIMSGESNVGYSAYGSAIFGILNKDSSAQNLVSGNQNIIGVGSGQSQVFGLGNTMSGISGATLLVGRDNDVTNSTSAVVGGRNNIVNSALGVAVFGSSNKDSSANTLVAGANNVVPPTAAGSIVTGSGNILKGTNITNAVAMGSGNTLNVISNNSAVFGLNNDVTGIGTLVAGVNNTVNATGSYNFVAGANNIVNGQYSTAVGSGNNASFANSMALGTSATTTKANQLVAKFTGGVVLSPLPAYATDVAADADATLISGSLYKLTTSRAVFQKP